MRRGADDLVGVIEALGLERPYAIGHSMGAGTVGDRARGASGVDPRRGARGSGMARSRARPGGQGSFMKLFADSLSGKSVDELVAMCAETSPTWDAAESVPWAESKAASHVGLISAHIATRSSTLLPDSESANSFMNEPMASGSSAVSGHGGSSSTAARINSGRAASTDADRVRPHRVPDRVRMLDPERLDDPHEVVGAAPHAAARLRA